MNTIVSVVLLVSFLQPAADRLHAYVSSATASEKQKPTEPIDINLATAKDFATLPGVGPKIGQRIVAFREKHGPFRRVEDLLVIRGIGRKKWKAIRPFLKVEPGGKKQ